MTMPVPPTTSPAQTRADAAARTVDATDTGSSTQDFSKVLSQQQPPSGKEVSSSSESPKTQLNNDKTQDPQDPDTTLALILDSAALPLMRAIDPTPVTASRGDATSAAAGTARAQGSGPAVLLPDTLITTAATTSELAKGSAPGLQASPKDTSAGQAHFAQAAEAAKGTTAGLQVSLPEEVAFPSQGKPTVAKAQEPQTLAQATTQAVPIRVSVPAMATSTDSPSDAAVASAGLMATPAPSGPQVTNPVITLAVATPLSSPQWAQGFGQQIVSIAQSQVNGLHTVQLHVNPPELGPVHITLQIGDASTQAAFVSPHAHVRQALENALPNLEQQFAQAGLSLGQASVSDQQTGQQGFNQSESSGQRHHEGPVFSLTPSAQAGAVVPNGLLGTPPGRSPNALVDTFA
ncbi:MAG TPA: flagellar hook-length control protein FliK [Castellaniella sp.]|uniref:flagellar hook-length control protein FliK n=1 Tax=Castellaniella sp. TaxID=1955812 RepID=UPI002EF85C87